MPLIQESDLFADLKSMVSVGLSSVSCAGLNLELVAKGLNEMKCLCIGLGGGSLPLFLTNQLQGLSSWLFHTVTSKED